MVKHKLLIWCVVFILVFSCLVQVCFAVDKSRVDEALIGAENDLTSAYLAATEAEQAGTNVSELLARLELAGTWLAYAHNAYRSGDYDEAYRYAMNCSDEVSGVASEAATLKLKAEEAYNEKLFQAAAISSVGLSVLFVLSLFGWRFLKNRYFKRVLKMKPEVKKAE